MFAVFLWSQELLDWRPVAVEGNIVALPMIQFQVFSEDICHFPPKDVSIHWQFRHFLPKNNVPTACRSSWKLIPWKVLLCLWVIVSLGTSGFYVPARFKWNAVGNGVGNMPLSNVSSKSLRRLMQSGTFRGGPFLKCPWFRQMFLQVVCTEIGSREMHATCCFVARLRSNHLNRWWFHRKGRLFG